MSEIYARFSSKYAVADSGCWLWTGHLDKKGRGNLRLGSRRIIASRLSYALHFDEIPDGLLVCHECDNPQCVNPDHLWLGTHQDNMADMAAKGRAHGPGTKGSERGHAVLDEQAAAGIWLRLCAGERDCNLAREFSVSHATIQDIKHRRTWTHVTEALLGASARKAERTPA